MAANQYDVRRLGHEEALTLPAFVALIRGNVTVHRMGSGSFFGRNTLLLRENEAAENVPDLLVFRENSVCPVNGYRGNTPQKHG